MSAPREKCEIPFFEKNGPPGKSPGVGSGHSVLGRDGICGKSRGQQRSLQWCGASFIHTWLLASWGSWGHLYTMSITRLAQLPLAARGSFSANRENVLIKPLTRQPASSRGLLGKVAHPSLLGSLSWCRVATEGSFELIAILLPQPPECQDL